MNILLLKQRKITALQTARRNEGFQLLSALKFPAVVKLW